MRNIYAMKRIYVLSAVALITACFLMPGARKVQAANITSAQSGNWGSTSTWVGGVVPGASDNVTIATGHTVTVDQPFSCTDLTINSGGTLNTFFGLTTTGNVTVNGTLGGSSTFGFDGAATFTNNGSVTTSDVRFDNPNSTIAQSIAGAGTWNIANMTIFANSTTTMQNAITFTVSNTINERGTLNLNGNPLTFNGGTMNIPGGTLAVGSSTVNFNGASFNNGGTVSGTGLFKAQPSLGTLNIDFGGNVGNGVSTFSIALEVVSGTTNATNGTAGGAITVDNGATLTGFMESLSAVTINSGATLGGNGSFFTFDGLGATLTNNGSITVDNFRFAPVSSTSQTITGNGTWAGAGTLLVGGNTTVTMSNAMTFAYATFQIGGGGTFNTGGNLLTLNGSTFTNSGTLSIGAGTVNFNGATFNNFSSITGTGLVKFQPTGGTVAFSTNFTFAPALEIVNGITNANGAGNGLGGTLTIDSGAEMKMVASGGISASNSVTVNAGATLSGTDANSFFVLNGAALVNNGSITVANFRFRDIGGGAFAQTLSGVGSFSNNTANIRGGDMLTLTSDHQMSTVIIEGTFGGGTLDITNRALKLSGAGTPLTVSGTIVTTGSTIEYDGTAAQTVQTNLNGASYNNLTINNAAGVTLPAAITIPTGATLTLAGGVFTTGSNLTMAGNSTIARSLGSISNTPTYAGIININYFGSAAITTGPELTNNAGIANNVTINDTAGVALSADATITGLLALTSADLNTAGFTLNMPAGGNSSGGFDVVGNVRRTGFTPGNALTFGNPNNLITINFGATPPTDITVNLAKTAQSGSGLPQPSVMRTYTITPNNGSAYNARLRLHYRDTELNGNSEPQLQLYEMVGATWINKGKGAQFDDGAAEQNWVERNNVTQFSPWTIANGAPTAAPASISGKVMKEDGTPLGGVLLELTGGDSVRRAITNSEGFYKFEDVEANKFYTIVPLRANYSFGPLNRSFSLIADKTDATFAATALAETANPLDTPEFFVRQQYLDFLDREPEQGGLDYWSAQLRGCRGDTNCINSQRISVAAAFFVEQEFQETGSFVYRLYKASYGVQPNFAQFESDRSKLIGGASLPTDKQAFADKWVTLPSFLETYPLSLTPDEFVKRLFDTAQLIDPIARQQQIEAMLNSGKTRAQVLSDVIETPELKKREYNPSFVLTEYFGYLRRDPDQGGYDFWLNVLNNRSQNNYRGMVCAFMTSAEYQKRFSSVAIHSNQECPP